MKLPKVDLIEAAAELGLYDPPPVVWDWADDLEHNAEYDAGRTRIRVHPTILTRWAHTGLPEVVRIRNPRNGLKFVVAHELAHYDQEQRDPSLFYVGGAYWQEQARALRKIWPGMTNAQLSRAHRNNKYEAEADVIARRIWRKVKLT